MSVKGGPDIETDGLVFHLDAAATSISKGYSTEGLRVEYLVVGGGGGGGGWSTAGGGGAGGFLSGDTRLAAGTYTVTVGAGGTRGDNSSSRTGTTGGNSQLGSSLVAYGGGGGGSASNINGLNGGSGGGGFCSSTAGLGGSGVSGQGNNGGNGGPGSWRSGSGGGADQAGGLGNGGYGSAPGGRGKISKLDFVWKYYAGGGASGGCSNGNNSGGLGGGGNGGRTNSDGTNGETNLGGGGGGGGCYNTRATFGGQGGSGIVIIRYWGRQKATGGDTVQYKNGYTIHTFTSSGSFVLSESIDGTSRNKIVGELINMASSNLGSSNGGYWVFDGATNEHIVFGAASGTYASFSVLVWFYPQSISSFENIIDCNYGSYASSGNIGPRLEINNAGNLIWIYSSTTNNNSVCYGHSVKASGLTINTWHFAAITYNGTLNSSVAYYNGVNSGISRALFGSPTGFVGVMNNVVIGKGFHLGSAERYFTGKISNVQIYNRDLSSAEILDNYNATKGRFGL